MNFRTVFAVALVLAAVMPAGAWAASYDKADYEWCFNKMPRFYDESFQACVDSNCDRISNKKLTQKRACYRRCTAEVVEACNARRTEAAAARPAARPAAKPLAPSPREVRVPERGVGSALRSTAPAPRATLESSGPQTGTATQAAPAQPAAARAPVAAAKESAEAPREQGFFNRLWQGLGGGEPAQPETASAAAGSERAATPPAAAEETERKGFFTRLMDGVGDGMTEGFNADYSWCRDNSGGHYQDLMRECTRGCMSGPSAASNRRQACLQSCRKESVATCIARRDGK